VGHIIKCSGHIVATIQYSGDFHDMSKLKVHHLVDHGFKEYLSSLF